MNNKGFSLVELLAAIAIMAIISAILTPIVTRFIKQNKVDACESLVTSIKSAASSYVSDNRYNSNIVKENFEVNVSTLQNNSYLKGSLTNPIDDTTLNGSVIVTYNKKTKTFSYQYKETKNGTEYIDKAICNIS